jgi:hypothetical protein
MSVNWTDQADADPIANIRKMMDHVQASSGLYQPIIYMSSKVKKEWEDWEAYVRWLERILEGTPRHNVFIRWHASSAIKRTKGQLRRQKLKKRLKEIQYKINDWYDDDEW